MTKTNALFKWTKAGNCNKEKGKTYSLSVNVLPWLTGSSANAYMCCCHAGGVHMASEILGGDGKAKVGWWRGHDYMGSLAFKMIKWLEVTFLTCWRISSCLSCNLSLSIWRRASLICCCRCWVLTGPCCWSKHTDIHWTLWLPTHSRWWLFYWATNLALSIHHV